MKRYVDECLAGKTGPREKDFNMRWYASLVAETHRILMRGGVFLYPRDTKDPTQAGRLRLLYGSEPYSVHHRAGRRICEHRARADFIYSHSLHQRVPLIFGACDEIERIAAYHREHNLGDYDAPLFGTRGLFRVSA